MMAFDLSLARERATFGGEREAALGRFVACYDELDAAILDGDAERIAELVALRGPIVDRLVRAFDGERLPEGIRQVIVAAEAELRLSLTKLHDQLFRALSQQRRVAHAVSRYDDAP